MKKITGKIMINLLGAVLLLTSTPVFGQVPDEVKALVGVYKGSWTIFGQNESGEIVEKMAWTDIMEASNPIVKNGRAYVTVIDTMDFGKGIPPQKMQGTEGYLLNSDGSLGDYFFEMSGRVYRMKMLEKDIWAYAMPADPMEMGQLGFPNVAFSQHIVNKVVTWEEGVEIHRISRVTTVSWKDKEGKEQWKQFVSLQGLHKREK